MDASTEQVLDHPLPRLKRGIDHKSLRRTIDDAGLPSVKLSTAIKAPHIAPYSRKWHGRAAASFALVEVDDQSPEGKLIVKVRRELHRHVGDKPTVTQRFLIDRAAILFLRLAQIDRKIIEEEHLTVLDNNQIIAWQNALTRILVALGVTKPMVSNRPSLADIRAEVSR